MSDRDVIITSTGIVPNNNAIAQKPSYLIKILSDNKKTKKLFVTIEQPKIETSHVQSKGFYYDGNEEELYARYFDIVNECDKSLHVEVWIPWHSIEIIRSLVFRGNRIKK